MCTFRLAPIAALLFALCAPFATRAVAAPTAESELIVLGVWVGERYDARSTGEVARQLRQLGEDARAARAPGAGDWSCASAECLGPIAKEHHASHLVQASIAEIDRDAKNFRISVRLYDRGLRRAHERQVSCDGCNADNRHEQVALAAAQLLKKASDKPSSELRNDAPQAPSSPPSSSPSAPPASPSSSPPAGAPPSTSNKLSTFEPSAEIMADSTAKATAQLALATPVPGPSDARTWRTKLSLISAALSGAGAVTALALTLEAMKGQTLCASEPSRQTCLISVTVPAWGFTVLTGGLSIVMRIAEAKKHG